MKTLLDKGNLFMRILFLTLFLSCSGCVYIVVGGIGAVGGYIVSPDTVEGVTENDIATVWDASTEIISIMGLILEKNETSGFIIAKINGAKVTVNISTVSESTVKLTVKARRFGLPKISTAQDVFVKVMSYLNQ